MSATTTVAVHTQADPDSEADLDNAIEQVIHSAAQGSSRETFVIDPAPAAGTPTLPRDVPVLHAGNSVVTIDGIDGRLDLSHEQNECAPGR
jgi:hypothetical protein